MTILCLASHEKGHELLRECKRQGWTVLLMTAARLREICPLDDHPKNGS